MQYQEKLDGIEARFESLERQMADPALISDQEAYRKTAKACRDLEEVVTKYREWKKVSGDLEEPALCSMRMTPVSARWPPKTSSAWSRC